MEKSKNNRVYLLISVFCIAICAVLVFCMLIDAPVPKIGEGADLTHRPPHGPTEPEEPANSRMAVTETYFSKMLSQYLPAGFPVSQIGVDIQKNGTIVLSAQSGQEELKNYLEQQGIDLNVKQRLLLGLLPESFELSAELDCTTAEDGGTLQTVPQKASYNDVEIDLNGLPSQLFTDIGAALNRLLVSTGYYFTGINITDGAIELLTEGEESY